MDAADSNYDINNYVEAKWHYNHPQLIKVHLDIDKLELVYIPAFRHIIIFDQLIRCNMVNTLQ